MADEGAGDYMVRSVAGDGAIRALALRSTALVEEARARHDTWPTATAALGRALTGTALLSADLKGRQSVLVRLSGDGPVGEIVCEGRAGGFLRGFVENPHVDLPLNRLGKLDVGAAVGRYGLLHVTRDYGLRERYTGSVPLVSGEIGEDLTRYLVVSEQVPSLVALGVLVESDGRVRAAGGLLLQLLPGAEEDWAARLEENVRALPPVSRMVDDGMAPEEMITRALSGFEPQFLGSVPIAFRCTCSRERVAGVLMSLGAAELEDMLHARGHAQVVCHFCRAVYSFGREELEAILKEAREGEDG